METKIRKKLSFCFLAFALSFGVCGCRESDEIAKMVYTADASEVDDTQALRPDFSDEVDMASSKKIESSEADTNREKAAPTKGSESNSDDTADGTGGSQAEKTAEGTPGKEGGKQEDDESGEVEDETDKDDDEWEDNSDTEDDDPAPDPEDDTNPENPNDGTSENGEEGGRNKDNAESRQVYDKDGNIIDLPSEVNSIAAPGEAGLIVQMLGGEGVLCASSDSFLDNSVAKSVFADEGIAEVAHLWSGDGSTAMSESNFEALLAMEPDCCIVISGQTNFSSEQLARLEENDIPYVLIPAMTPAYNIETAVQIVGEVLGEHEAGDTTSGELAQQYVEYEQELVSNVVSRKGYFQRLNFDTNTDTSVDGLKKSSFPAAADGMYTTVLWDWDPGFWYEYYQNGGTYISQSGAAVIEYGWNNAPAAYYMSVAGVMNTSSEPAGSTKPGIFFPLYFIHVDNDWPYTTGQQGGVMEEGYYENSKYYTGEETLEFSAQYKKGTYDVYNPVGLNDLTRAYFTGEVKGDGTDGTDRLDIRLGWEKFPCLIAATKEIKANVEASKANPLGLYRICPLGIEVPGIDKNDLYQNTGVAPSPYYGAVEDVVNNTTTSRLDYEIYVNPCGAGNWLLGSVESCLESVWISNLFYGDETYPTSEMESKIKEFYQTFYRCDDAPLSDILDGL